LLNSFDKKGGVLLANTAFFILKKIFISIKNPVI